jgi:hypothetical protein
MRSSNSTFWVELFTAGELDAKLSLENGKLSKGEPDLTPWLTAGDDAEPGMLRDNAGVLRRGALMGGKEVVVGENASSAERFTLDFENWSYASREVGCVVEVNVKGYLKDWEDGEVDLAR